jgi:hypothetical protein
VLAGRYRKKAEFDLEDGFFRAFVMGKIGLPGIEEYIALQGLTVSEEEVREIKQMLG